MENTYSDINNPLYKQTAINDKNINSVFQSDDLDCAPVNLDKNTKAKKDRSLIEKISNDSEDDKDKKVEIKNK